MQRGRSAPLDGGHDSRGTESGAPKVLLLVEIPCRKQETGFKARGEVVRGALGLTRV